MNATEQVLRPSLLAFLGERAGFTTRALGDRCPLGEGHRIFGLWQVHSGDVIRLRGEDDPAEVRRRQADGLVATEPGLALTIRVADCVPVLVSTRDGGAVAALHAGWRGLAAGIITRGVMMLSREAGARARDLVAVAGPAIGPCCYEVDVETGERIARPSPDGVLSQPDGGKVRADLWRAAVNQLGAAGLPPEGIEAIRLCTRCHPGLFHSYRRHGAHAGRQIGFISTPAGPGG